MANGGSDYNILAVIIGLFTFFMIVVASVKGKKTAKMIPFIIGIGAGLAAAIFFTAFSYAAPNGSQAQKVLRIVDFTPIVNCFSPIRVQSFLDYPKFTFILGIQDSINGVQRALDGAAVGNIALLFIPIAVVELAQHIFRP